VRQDYPILEFDPSRAAVIEPSKVVGDCDAPQHCVICFFKEVFDKLVAQGTLKTINERRWEDGLHTFHELEVEGRRVAAFHPGVGGPVAAGMLEIAIAMGCTKFIACGGAGVLDRNIAVGRIVVPQVAVRDEGTSYHYLPPGREIEASEAAVGAIEQTLRKHGIDHLLAKTWTTDAPYRETPSKVARRRSEGCVTVEMEAATFFAVARFRGVTLGQMLYAGDDVSGEDWDHRDWADQGSIRESLFWLAVEACLRLS
jgi:uridine phosphorylase